MAARLRLEDKYLAVKLGVHQRVTPRRAWQQWIKPALARGETGSVESIRWEIRILEESGFHARELIELTYRHGVPWVEENVPDGEAWIDAVLRVAMAQMGALIERLKAEP